MNQTSSLDFATRARSLLESAWSKSSLKRIIGCKSGISTMKSIPGWVILCFGVLLVFTEGFQRQRPILHQIPILRRNMDVKVVDAIEAVTAVSDTASLAQAVVPSVVQVAPVAATASAAMFSDPDSARYFLAGGTCASVSHGITVPIDVVKTRLQTEPEKYVAEEGVIGAAKRIVEREGLGTLGTGMGPTLTGYLVQGAIKFGFYEALKPAVKDFFLAHGFADEMGSLSPWLKIAALVLASASAELLGSSALAPFEAARIRMVSQPDFAKGIVEALSKLRDEEGVEALFNGLPAILVKQIPYTVVSLPPSRRSLVAYMPLSPTWASKISPPIAFLSPCWQRPLVPLCPASPRSQATLCFLL